jgi:hypothetical protein
VAGGAGHELSISGGKTNRPFSINLIAEALNRLKLRDLLETVIGSIGYPPRMYAAVKKLSLKVAVFRTEAAVKCSR